MINEHVVELLAGFSLEILDDEELLRVARHLPRCAACMKDAEAYVAVRDHIVLSTPVHLPASDLRTKVLARVRESAVQVSDERLLATTEASEKVGKHWWQSLSDIFIRRVGLALAVLALLIIGFLSINNILLTQRVDRLEARFPQEQVLIARLDGTVSAPQATGYVIVYRNNKYGSLTVENAPVLGENQQYQIWLIRNGERTSGGVFSVNNSGYGVLQVYSHDPLDTYDSFGITIEPAGGSIAPTGEKVLGGSL